MKIDYSKPGALEMGLGTASAYRVDLDGSRAAVSEQTASGWRLLCVAHWSRRGRLRHRSLSRRMRRSIGQMLKSSLVRDQRALTKSKRFGARLAEQIANLQAGALAAERDFVRIGRGA